MSAGDENQAGPNMHIQEACRGLAQDVRRRLETVRTIMSGQVKPSSAAKALARGHLRGLDESLREMLRRLD
ncbi:MAG: hypothetical protein HQ530_03905 [Parcubacteria group bacterium]|nr:hypothetical protein [Parcubacteria group bacterium]